MWKEFKAFIMRGNVLDLAVAVIIAGAFGAIVSSFTRDILMPPIGLALGDMDFTQLKYVMKEAVTGADGTVTKPEVAIAYGMFIKYIIDFLIIAFVLFLIVKAYAKTRKKKEEEKTAAPAGPTDNELLMEIRDLLKK
ncbi:MAG TPA: large-conductance mechanosensitive channel protein MscL [Bacteroidetes bacterium]|nr:large-conductance mechanosensitive channel protein MscL [Bacteroidota bacterium]